MSNRALAAGALHQQQSEMMKATNRIGRAWAAGVLAGGLAGSFAMAWPAAAQSVPADSNQAAPQPATNVGPRELENFTLNGAVTRSVETPANGAAPAPSRSSVTTATTRPRNTPAPAGSSAVGERVGPGPGEQRAAGPLPAATGATSAVDLPRPPLGDPLSSVAGAADAPAIPSAPDRLPWPWLVAAALALLAIGGLVLGRSRRRLAAGAPAPLPIAAPAPPIPTPAAARAQDPLPQRAPAPPAEPDFVGLVGTRLRPRVELDFRPLSCRIEGGDMIFEFDLGLRNAGHAPAREVIVQAAYFNAGQDQSQSLASFFDRPAGGIDEGLSLAPLDSILIRNRVVAPLTGIQEFEVEGRKLFVPLIAFTAHYQMPRGAAQTARAYLLGRRSEGAKLAPLRLDRRGQPITDLDFRQLPDGRST